MMAKSLGSTLNFWKIERIVTGSVEDRIAPKIMQSKKEILKLESIPVIENI
jgi:hypothetical protein